MMAEAMGNGCGEHAYSVALLTDAPCLPTLQAALLELFYFHSLVSSLETCDEASTVF
jgi:hypothetical protein